MTARSPSAFALSSLLHASVVAVILLGVFYSEQNEPAKPVVFELVAGGGNNYAATVAPALGSPDGRLKLDIPKVVPAPTPEPASPPADQPQPAPEVQPVAEAQPVAVEAAPVKPAPAKVPDFSKSIKRTINRKVRKAEAQIKAERVAEEKRLSKEEFDRLHKQSGAGGGKTASASPHSGRVPRIDAQGIANGVIGGSTANTTGGAGGRALTSEEHSLIDSYYAMLKQRLHDALEKPPGLSDRLVTVIEVRILADGSLRDARVIQSSGSDEFDHAALDTFAQVGSIGPKPDGRSEWLKIPFRMLDDDSTR
jgi:colicin import membrane protein